MSGVDSIHPHKHTSTVEGVFFLCVLFFLPFQRFGLKWQFISCPYFTSNIIACFVVQCCSFPRTPLKTLWWNKRLIRFGYKEHVLNWNWNQLQVDQNQGFDQRQGLLPLSDSWAQSALLRWAFFSLCMAWYTFTWCQFTWIMLTSVWGPALPLTGVATLHKNITSSDRRNCNTKQLPTVDKSV